MVFSGYATEFVTPYSSNFDAGRRGVRIDRFVLHHQACDDSDVTLGMMHTGSREVSATYVVRGSGVAVGVVKEQDTPFTNDDGPWNRRSITFEIENQRLGSNPYGKPTQEAHEVVAKIIADASHRYNIPLDRDHVVRHRELYSRYGVGYATACPGDLDIDWIVNRARVLRGQGPVPPAHEVVTVAAPTEAVAYAGEAGVKPWKALQTWLTKSWGYTGDCDGFPGRQTWIALQKYLKANWKYTGDCDGAPGILTWQAAQRWLKAKFQYEGTIDGLPGNLTFGALARAGQALYPKPAPTKATVLAKTVVDGVPGKVTWTRIQAILRADGRYKADLDGVPGILTYLALQSFLSVHAGYKGVLDGKPAKVTWAAFQKFLAAHYGYTGAIDGEPGQLTWEAAQRWANSF
jgi:hypothetical protein